MADESFATLSVSGADPIHPERSKPPNALLVLVLSRHALNEPSGCLHLDGSANVAIRRGDEPLDRLHVPVGEGTRFAYVELRSPQVTRNHAQIHGSTVGWTLVDEGSKNGTIVDGRKLVGEGSRLLDGSVIDIGPYMFVFRMARCRGEFSALNERTSIDSETSLLHQGGLATFNRPLAARFADLRRLAATSLPVLILGQTGTGKERVARSVHDLSGRRGAFVAVNCGAIHPSTMMAEFFGHKKSAFTGADSQRSGYFREADIGTLFLDEVGELTLDGQKALLRVLQECEVLPVGADRPVAVDFRVVAATNRDLEAMVARGEFRADLLARLQGFDLVMPRLIARREDLGMIIRGIMRKARLSPRLSLSSQAYSALMAYEWPQNIRELENVLVRAACLAEDGKIEHGHLPTRIQERRSKTVPSIAPVAKRPFDPGRREDMVELLTVHRGNITATAQACGVSERQVRRWVERHQLDVDGFRKLRST